MFLLNGTILNIDIGQFFNQLSNANVVIISDIRNVPNDTKLCQTFGQVFFFKVPKVFLLVYILFVVIVESKLGSCQFSQFWNEINDLSRCNIFQFNAVFYDDRSLVELFAKDIRSIIAEQLL